jgi:FkbM family methyltransferase
MGRYILNDQTNSAQTQSNLRHVLSCLNKNQHFHSFDDVDLFRLMSEDTIVRAADLIGHSSAQLRQDIFAAVLTGFRRDGYFVEVGATDGAYLSNTLMLETIFDWRGILAEPAVFWHKALVENRKAVIETRCVHAETGRSLLFREVSSDRALSTIAEYAEEDLHRSSRSCGEDYMVQSISLTDLLLSNKAPRQIDYLSLDTEGSEYDILRTFDFDAFQFGIITCEHNYSKTRTSVLKLLTAKGYTRVLNKVSQFDDWYVHNSKLDILEAHFPDWRQVSSHNEVQDVQVLSENEGTIRMLQETVENLIVDRDHYKRQAEDQQKTSENQRIIRMLQETVENLIVDRDQYKRQAEGKK